MSDIGRLISVAELRRPMALDEAWEPVLSAAINLAGNGRLKRFPAIHYESVPTAILRHAAGGDEGQAGAIDMKAAEVPPTFCLDLPDIAVDAIKPKKATSRKGKILNVVSLVLKQDDRLDEEEDLWNRALGLSLEPRAAHNIHLARTVGSVDKKKLIRDLEAYVPKRVKLKSGVIYDASGRRRNY